MPQGSRRATALLPHSLQAAPQLMLALVVWVACYRVGWLTLVLVSQNWMTHPLQQLQHQRAQPQRWLAAVAAVRQQVQQVCLQASVC